MSDAKRLIYPVLRWIYYKLPEPVRRMYQRVLLRQQLSRKPVYNLWLLESGEPDITQVKRALVSYQVLPFQTSPEGPKNCVSIMAKSIIRILNELGYIVDVVEYSDISFTPRQDYHLFIGHGGYNFERIAQRLGQDVPKIYFSSGCYWKAHNEQELSRLAALRDRRGIDIPPERVDISEECACAGSEAIITVGNNLTRKSYDKFPHVFTLNVPAQHDEHFNKRNERIKFTAARHNFLFFAGSGNVHKGLDLLLEAFSRIRENDINLYICQIISPEFHMAYRQELENTPNIHNVGFVPLRSEGFYSLIDQCAFTIFPSCSEGQPCSVVECMHQGLIPVVSRETGLDTGDYGIMLETCSIDEITRVIQDLSRRPPEWCEEMSRKTRQAALTEFSESAFHTNMKKVIEVIVGREA